MAKSSFGMDTVLRLATSPLPRPVQYALGSRFRFYIALVCIAAALFFGVINLGWINGRPSVTVDRQKLQEIRQDVRQGVREGVNQLQQNNPNSALAPLVNDYLNKNLPNNTPPNYAQPYNNGYPAPTNYNTPGQTGSHPMVYPQQQNALQPLTGAPQQYQPNQYGKPYAAQQMANGYPAQPGAQVASPQYSNQPQYGQQQPYAAPQYGTPGYSNPHATQPSNYPPTYNQYPTSAGYPNNNPSYQGYGQPARTTVPQYGAPGYR